MGVLAKPFDAGDGQYSKASGIGHAKKRVEKKGRPSQGGGLSKDNYETAVNNGKRGLHRMCWGLMGEELFGLSARESHAHMSRKVHGGFLNHGGGSETLCCHSCIS